VSDISAAKFSLGVSAGSHWWPNSFGHLMFFKTLATNMVWFDFALFLFICLLIVSQGLNVGCHSAG